MHAVFDNATTVKTVSGIATDAILEALGGRQQPVLLKGLVSDWPLVQAGLKSGESARDYLMQFYRDYPVVVYQAGAEKKGRIFYNEDFSALAFQSARGPLPAILEKIFSGSNNAATDTYYVGSTTVDACLPGFREQNDIPLNVADPIISIWLGNRSVVPAHFDAPDNIACCAAGRRRFVMFPTEQVENLYLGPLDFTPSGQVVSTVDFSNPDLKRYPKFSEAAQHAVIAELEPGDALFVPSLWWHQVESLEDFNILLNYWWREAPAFMEMPMNMLHHAILSLRDLPPRERAAWKSIFDYYIFSDDAARFDHLPEAARGFLNPLDETSARRLRAWLLNKLNR